MRSDSTDYAMLRDSGSGRRMIRKNVYLNDQLIGQARTWVEVYALIKQRGILFVNKPGAAEGPSGFYVSGSFTRRSAIEAAEQKMKIKPAK
jgi:hypothetical protein